MSRHSWSRALAALVSSSLLACGLPLEGEEGPLESPPSAARSDELVATSCTSRTGTFERRAESLLRAQLDIYGVGEQQQSGWGATTLIVPPGTRRTTVSTTPRIEEGGVSTMVASPIPAGLSEANLKLVLNVLSADGTVLCEQQTVLANSWVTAFSDRRVVAHASTWPLSCTFDHDTRGQAITARLELRAWGRVASGVPGEAHAGGYAYFPAVTQTHCGLELGWCTHAGSRIVTLDANGDGRTDQLCHTATTSHIQMNVTPSSGEPKETVDYDVLGFCGGADQLLTGDVDGDGKDDLVCVTPSTRRVRVSFANSLGLFDRAREVDATASVPATCPRPLLADFDGDGKDDLLCQASIPTIELADGTGRFVQANFRAPGCYSALTLRGEYLTGDVNADGRADLLCHEGGTTPRNRVYLGQPNGTVSTTSTMTVDSFCSHATAQLVLADANGDGRDDMACITGDTGYVHVDLAQGNGTFDGTTERSIDVDFCVGGGVITRADFAADGTDGLICQQRPAAPGISRNLLLPRL